MGLQRGQVPRRPAKRLGPRKRLLHPKKSRTHTAELPTWRGLDPDLRSDSHCSGASSGCQRAEALVGFCQGLSCGLFPGLGCRQCSASGAEVAPACMKRIWTGSVTVDGFRPVQVFRIPSLRIGQRGFGAFLAHAFTCNHLLPQPQAMGRQGGCGLAAQGVRHKGS